MDVESKGASYRPTATRPAYSNQTQPTQGSGLGQFNSPNFRPVGGFGPDRFSNTPKTMNPIGVYAPRVGVR